MPGGIPSAETKAWMCTADDCCSSGPKCTKPFVVCSFIYFAVIEFGIIILKSFVS